MAQFEERFAGHTAGEMHGRWPPREPEDASRLAWQEPCGDVTGSNLVLGDVVRTQICERGKQDVSLRRWPSVSFISTPGRRRLFEGTLL